MKQNGAVLAKGWLMGLQFATMLKTAKRKKASPDLLVRGCFFT